jgi:hypothetical protein
MIEILNKKTKKIETMPIKEWILNQNRLGAQGKINILIDLMSGEIFQDLDYCYRLTGLKTYKWNWNL